MPSKFDVLLDIESAASRRNKVFESGADTVKDSVFCNFEWLSADTSR